MVVNKHRIRLQSSRTLTILVLLFLLQDPLVVSSDSKSYAMKLESWTSNLYLTFSCSLGQANVYFTPPSVPWNNILVQIRSDSGFHARKDLAMDNVKKLVNSSSGLARVTFTDSSAFNCFPKHQGYQALVKVLSFDSTNQNLGCTRCEPLTTPPGCLYYPNGTMLPDTNNCRRASPPDLTGPSLTSGPSSPSAEVIDINRVTVTISVTVFVLLLLAFLSVVAVSHCRGRSAQGDLASSNDSLNSVRARFFTQTLTAEHHTDVACGAH
ncbi:hypothetical protein BOX15_Mlig023993g3 [Macrostomum lignano]|uniref:Uncharacterized protein n=1 Tax=Macrostomum lignano TaxID=282301 RepID=A0A267FPV0_9PLAT|nr:hypothetical protein BOX15_Mlig023993g1 [Macrostomum lignano]PAA74982.1 hypothetical protein BOX15_Mlig023993g3 [Macrostomum lignano]